MCNPTCEANGFGEVHDVDDRVAGSTEHPFDDECHQKYVQKREPVNEGFMMFVHECENLGGVDVRNIHIEAEVGSR